MRYAIIDNSTNLVVNIIKIDDGVNFPASEGFTHVQSDTAEIGYSYSNGTFTAPTLSADEQKALNKEKARAAFIKIDVTLARCQKLGVTFPTEWQTYASELRAIMDSGEGSLPTQPAYPSGT